MSFRSGIIFFDDLNFLYLTNSNPLINAANVQSFLISPPKSKSQIIIRVSNEVKKFFQVFYQHMNKKLK
ncbi:MAG: hypothetical protein C4308_09265 [Chitinophagaceae bacterium]